LQLLRRRLCRRNKMAKEKQTKLGAWDKYLTLWVALCIIAGISLGRVFPQISDVLGKLEVAHVSIPIAICLFAMIYPIMVQIDFQEVIKAGKNLKPTATTLEQHWQLWSVS
jgi:ACR3 family arsenite transporter